MNVKNVDVFNSISVTMIVRNIITAITILNNLVHCYQHQQQLQHHHHYLQRLRRYTKSNFSNSNIMIIKNTTVITIMFVTITSVLITPTNIMMSMTIISMAVLTVVVVVIIIIIIIFIIETPAIMFKLL